MSVQTSVPAGRQPAALCSAQTTPTSTQLCSVKFPFDFLPGVCFLCWKTSSLRQRDPLVHSAVTSSCSVSLKASLNPSLTSHRGFLTGDKASLFFRMPPRHPADRSQQHINAESNQSAFFSATPNPAKCVLSCSH